MDRSNHTHLLGFGKPAVYRITVQGQLDQRTINNIADARVEAGDPDTMRLRVRVLDQAGLIGVLDALQGLHLPILSIQLISYEGETNVD